MYTDEQIKERANAIGNRPYHPVMPDLNESGELTDKFIQATHFGNFYTGITIKQELMRTAMGAIIPLEYPQRSGEAIAATSAIMFTNAMLTQMAKDELGVEE